MGRGAGSAQAALVRGARKRGEVIAHAAMVAGWLDRGRARFLLDRERVSACLPLRRLKPRQLVQGAPGPKPARLTAQRRRPDGYQAFFAQALHQPLAATRLPANRGQGAAASAALPW